MKFHIIIDRLASYTPSPTLIRASKRSHSPKLSLSLNHPLFSLLLWGVEFGFHYCLSLNHQALINTHLSILSSSFLLCPLTVISKHTTPQSFVGNIAIALSFLTIISFSSTRAFHTATIWSRQQRPSNWYHPKKIPCFALSLSLFSPLFTIKKQNGQVGQ